MMTTVILFFSVLWIVRIIGNAMSFSHLWWVKEYRWDRMIIHLKTPQGKFVYLLPWKRPRLSPKSVLLTGMLLVALGVIVYFSSLPPLLSLLVADIVSFPLTFLIVGMLNVPVKLYHDTVIHRAEHLLRSHKSLTVIGITGSYGKTSTKEYLATLLSSKYATLKTEASKNAPIGISEVVVSSLRPDHKVFVVEMGAYKKGEIAYMSSLVRPEIAIVTAINAQHQDLFGSIDNTMRAKYELVAGLTGKRIAICNADDPRVRTMGEWAKRDGVTVWWYGKNDALPRGSKTFYAADIRTDAQGVRFSCVSGKFSAFVRAEVIGEHQVSNLLAAIAGSVAVGMSLDAAAKAATAILPVSHMLQARKGPHGVTFIDDTFNNNPDAAKAALDVLSKQSGKKILVFQPMIELGTFAQSSHYDVGAYAGKICDAIILTNDNWKSDFIGGVRSVNPNIPVSVLSAKSAATYINEHTMSGDTVLFKSKEAALVMRRLLPV